jgi:hypothetical protein
MVIVASFHGSEVFYRHLISSHWRMSVKPFLINTRENVEVFSAVPKTKKPGVEQELRNGSSWLLGLPSNQLLIICFLLILLVSG